MIILNAIELLLAVLILTRKNKNNNILWALFLIVGVINLIQAILY